MRFRHGSAALAGALAWRLLLFVGAQGSDDGVYSDMAHDLLNGSHHLAADVFSTRIGYIASIAASYGIFGAGPFTLVLPNLAFSLAGIVLGYLLAREFLDESGARRTAALLVIFPLDVFFATEAHTDLPLAVFLSGAVLLFLRARKSGSIPAFAAAGAVLGLGHLFKESAFFGLAAMLAVGGKPRPRDAWTLAGFAGVVAVEAIVYGVLTGDPMFRFTATRIAQIQNIADLHRSTPSTAGLLVNAITQFVNPASVGFAFFGLFPAMALISAAIALKTGNVRLRPVALWMAVLLALLIFWPIRLIPYQPALWNHPRIFLLAEVPMAILVADLLSEPRKVRSLAIAGVLVISSIGASMILRVDARRLTEGARRAYDQLPATGTVVSDPRTTYLFRLYDGYRDTRQWLPWSSPIPAGPQVRVVNETWIGQLRHMHGLVPPAGFERPEGAPTATILVKRRGRLRTFFREEGPPEEVRVYRIP
jgi:hypothetical protein